MASQVHANLVVQFVPGPGESADDLASELMDALKTVSMEFGLIFHSDLRVVVSGEEGYVSERDPSALVQVA